MQALVLSVFVISCLLIDAAFGLQCIECSSVADPKCGVTFEYSMAEAKKAGLVTTCQGGTVACRKTETRDTVKSLTVVSRSCWNATGAEVLNDEFLSCKELMVRSEVCYCKAGDNADPCNGQERVTGSLAAFLLGLLPYVMKSFF